MPILPTLSSAAFGVLAVGTLTAAIVDVRTRRIPNVLTATMAGIGIGLAAAGVSGVSAGASALGLLVGFALMMPGHALGATGAGDVKLMAAVGAIVGPVVVISAFLFTAVAGGVLAVGVALKRKRLAATLSGTSQLIAAPGDARQQLHSAGTSSKFAYGPAIAVGSILAAVLR